MADELTRALLLEEVSTRRRIAEALFLSVTGGVPLLGTLVDTEAATADILARYLARTEVPFLRVVAPVLELVDMLPPGICARLLALPVRLDPVTGTVDVCVAHPEDPHPANELAFHLRAPVRVVRGTVAAIEEALRRLRLRNDGPADRFREAAAHAAREMANTIVDDERLYDSRPRATEPPPPTTLRDPRPRLDTIDDSISRFPSLPPIEPALLAAVPTPGESTPRRSLVIEPGSSLPPPPIAGLRVKTPAWGTPIHSVMAARQSEPPSQSGSDIPIPLTRKTLGPPLAGRENRGPGAMLAPEPRTLTQRPPSLADQNALRLGEGYSFDNANLRDIVERPLAPRSDAARLSELARPIFEGRTPSVPPTPSYFPPAPPLPGMSSPPRMPFADTSGVLAALRNAGSRDEVLELVLAGSLTVAGRAALFIVKKGGYVGWMGSPELGGRRALESVLVPIDAASIIDRAVREDLYLGPIPVDATHAMLGALFTVPMREIAIVPVRVSGKTAVVILADRLGDTMLGTRRLEELARAAGDAFARIVRSRQR